MNSIVVFVSLMMVYLWSMPTSITLEDAGLFQMVCRFNGLAHPPGYPLFTMICPAFTQIPFLNPVISGNLISALFAAAAGVIVFNILLVMTSDRAAAYVGALCLGVSTAFWSQAIIIEVYALNIFLYCLLLLLLYHYLISLKISYLYGFIFFYSLSLSNHWPLIAVATPGFILMLLPKYDVLLPLLKSVRVWLVASLLIVLGLLPYVTILLKPEPFISLLGPVTGLSELFYHVSRSAYTSLDSVVVWQKTLANLWWLCSEITSQFGWIPLILIVYGVFCSWKLFPVAHSIAFVTAFIGSTFVLILMVGFDDSFVSRALFKPYPLISYTIMSLWLAVGFSAGMAQLSARWRLFQTPVLRVAFVAILVTLVVIANYEKNYRHDSNFVQTYAQLVLDKVKPNSNLFLRGDNEVSPIGFLHHVLGMRPDITLFSTDNLVFSNRLSSPLIDPKKQDENVREFVKAAEVSSYFLSNDVMAGGTDYGIFVEHRPVVEGQPEPAYVFDKEIADYLDEVLRIQEQMLVTDDHTLIFLESVLLNFARQYIGYAFEHNSSDVLDDDFRRRLYGLKKTFAGKLSTLNYILHHQSTQVSKILLLELVDTSTTTIPRGTLIKNRALFYEYAGHVALLPSELYPPDQLAALAYFTKSLAIYPATDNASLCQLKRIYNEQSQHDKLMQLNLTFGDAFDSCIRKPASQTE